MVKDTLLNDLSEQNMKDFDLIDTYCTFSTILEEVKNHNHLIAGVLRSCSVEDVQDGKLKIVAKSKFHAEKLEEEKRHCKIFKS